MLHEIKSKENEFVGQVLPLHINTDIQRNYGIDGHPTLNCMGPRPIMKISTRNIFFKAYLTVSRSMKKGS